MGYWDKKDEAKKTKAPVQTKEVKKEEYDSINHEALEQFEKEALDSAQNTLSDVEGIAHDIARQKKQFGDLLSTGFWCALVFNNDVQKQQFLVGLDYDPLWTFIDGKEFAKRCGIKIDEPDHDYSERKIQKAYKERARPIPDKLKGK